jgi:hypothetical protein
MARRKRTQEEITVAQAENGAVLEDEVVEETAEQVVEETAAPEGEAQAEQTDAEAHKCRMCGRKLTAEQSVIRGLGPLCAGHVARELGVPVAQLSVTDPSTEGYVAEDAVHNAVETLKTKVNSVDPADFNADENEHPNYPDQGAVKWVRLVDVGKSIDEQGRSMARFIRAFGGDRGFQAPLAWYWHPVYVGRVRMLPAECELHYDDIPFKRERGAAEAPAAEGEQVVEAAAE